MYNPLFRLVMQRNPEIGQTLRDPQTLRQAMEMARNPSMMEEMMRQQDRAISNLTSLPGGMNHLQRIYRDIQEPMMNAVSNMGIRGGGQSADGGSENPFADLAGVCVCVCRQPLIH